MTGNEMSQIGSRMFMDLESSREVRVTHAVEPDGFPSQHHGPFLIVYGRTRDGNWYVQPRVLSVSGAGVDAGPNSAVERLRYGLPRSGDPGIGDSEFFSRNGIDVRAYIASALAHAPA